MTPVELELFASADGYTHSNFDRDLIASRELLKRDSTVLDADGLAFIALCANRPREALAALASIDPSRVGDRNVAHWNKATIAEHEIGDFRREMALATTGRTRLAAPFGQLWMLEDQTRALAAQGAISELRRKVDSAVAAWVPHPHAALRSRFQIPDNPAEMYESVALELFAHGGAPEALAFVHKGLAWIATRPASEANEDVTQHSKARLLMLAQQWSAAQTILARLSANDTLYADAGVELAITAAALGDTTYAVKAMHVLDSLAHRKYSFGAPLLREARIAASLGRTAAAAELLETALRAGTPFDWRWHRAPEFRAMRDSPQFQALISPKG